MSLNIKNEEAHKMAAELAAIRGVSMTAVVVVVVVVDLLKTALKAERPKEDPDSKAKRLIAWVKGMNKGKKEKNLTSDHSWLYDENGLPH